MGAAGGCAASGAQGAVVLVTEEELATRLHCDVGVEPGVDLSTHHVLQVRGSMSPATIGWAAYDDGARVTVVTKFRSPCPDDPRPMPMEFTRWFLAPVGEQRALGEATCTAKAKCPQ